MEASFAMTMTTLLLVPEYYKMILSKADEYIS